MNITTARAIAAARLAVLRSKEFGDLREVDTELVARTYRVLTLSEKNIFLAYSSARIKHHLNLIEAVPCRAWLNVERTVRG